MPRIKKYQSEEERYEASLKFNRAWKDRNREYTRQYSRNKYRALTSSKEGYAQVFLKRCKYFTKDTDVDLEFILSLDERCAITNRPFVYGNKYSNTFSNPLAPSIDRIDSHRGYYKDNIQIIYNCINKMKNDMANDDFLRLWKELTIA